MRVRASSFVLLFVLSKKLWACSVCGCDPAAGTLGLDRPSPHALRLAVEDRYLSKESGVADGFEGEREDRALVRAQYAVLPRLVLQAELPIFLFRDHLNALNVRDDTGRGLGDVAVSARYEVLRAGGFLPRHVLAVIGTLKLPTGANDRALAGAEPDEHLQLGSGSFDGIAGVSYVYGMLPWNFFASAQARLNGANSRGFRYGNALFATVGARRTLFEDTPLVLSLEAQARSAGKDRLAAGGGYDENSGGQVYYATAGAAYALTESLLLRGTLQVPVATSLNGAQSEHPVAYLQLAYDFAL